MAAKMAIKDVARVEQLPLSESNRLTKLIPKHMPERNGKELKPTLSNCYDYVPEFKPEVNSSNPLVRETLNYARALEGNVRNTGVHACGVIICRDDITDWVPVSTANDKEEGKLLVTQYEGRVIEETGLIKMDFLGLKTLSILKEAVTNIKQTRGVDIDLDNIPIDDPKTYKLYCEGRTIGTFQFESPGMQKYLRELQPSTFEDLIAMNALYRPGPMQYIPDFIKRKHGESPIEYAIPEMEMYLKDTYGVTVYQEQVMLLSRLLAGFTRGESDTLRKAMGKKLIDKMNHLKGKFMSGGQERGHDPKVLEKYGKTGKRLHLTLSIRVMPRAIVGWHIRRRILKPITPASIWLRYCREISTTSPSSPDLWTSARICAYKYSGRTSTSHTAVSVSTPRATYASA